VISLVDVSGEGGPPMRVLSIVTGQGCVVVPAYRNMEGTI
jgi:hypothetical protein